MDARGFWFDKFADPETRPLLGPRNKIGFQMSEDFRVTLEGKYPWLRLCEASWKVAQVWQTGWSSWASTYCPANVSDNDSDTDAAVVVGVKRSHTDEGDHPRLVSKKSRKGKERAVEEDQVPKSDPRPPRPKPTKRGAKVATVSDLHLSSC